MWAPQSKCWAVGGWLGELGLPEEEALNLRLEAEARGSKQREPRSEVRRHSEGSRGLQGQKGRVAGEE